MPTEFLRNWWRSAAPSSLPSSTPTDMPIANSAEPLVTGPQPVGIWQMHTALGPAQVRRQLVRGDRALRDVIGRRAIGHEAERAAGLVDREVARDVLEVISLEQLVHDDAELLTGRGDRDRVGGRLVGRHRVGVRAEAEDLRRVNQALRVGRDRLEPDLLDLRRPVRIQIRRARGVFAASEHGEAEQVRKSAGERERGASGGVMVLRGHRLGAPLQLAASEKRRPLVLTASRMCQGSSRLVSKCYAH